MTSLDSFGIVKDDEIFIDSQNWEYLNNIYDVEDIKLAISDAIGKNNLPMPMRQISKDDAASEFKKLLDLDHKDIIQADSEWFTRYEYKSKYFFSDVVFSCCNIGNKTSDYFQQENRWMCDSITAPSPYRSWTQEKFRLTMLKALWSLKLKQVTSKDLRNCIALRKYIASQFRPSTAKAVYNHFKAKNVLDFSSGWGDRLCGFLASDAQSYFGIDPNSKLFPKYYEMIEYLQKDKQVQLVNECAEDVDFKGQKFDLVFTSPPYYTLERYTQEDNQSWKKYKQLQDWLENFLFKSLSNCWDALEDGGKMVINISDVYAKHTVNKICDPMNDFLDSLKNSKYCGCMGYQMRKRPNSKSLKGKLGKFAEPMWVWEKTK